MSQSSSHHSRVHVVVGYIADRDNRVLIARRPIHLHQGGLWEFPGGKVEDGEQAIVALARELKEEVDIEVVSASPFIQVAHDYGDKSVLLDVWRVDEFTGEARGIEGQRIQWVPVAALDDYQFPEANAAIIVAAKHSLKKIFDNK